MRQEFNASIYQCIKTSMHQDISASKHQCVETSVTFLINIIFKFIIYEVAVWATGSLICGYLDPAISCTVKKKVHQDKKGIIASRHQHTRIATHRIDFFYDSVAGWNVVDVSHLNV